MFKTQALYQNDEKWRSIKLGDTVETIGQWGGLLTSVTMMLNGIGYQETPETVNQKLKKEDGFLKALLIPSYLPYVWPNCAYLGMERCERSSAPIARINAAVAAGKPVILQVDSKKQLGTETHYVLVKAKKGNDYALYDPYKYDGDNPRREVLLSARYKHDTPKPESEISAVLWFDFHDPAFPRPPKAVTIPEPPDAHRVYVTEDGVALRARPSAEGYPWKLLVRGTELTCLEPNNIAPFKAGKTGEWLRVQDPRGDQGYVAAWYVTSTNFLALVSLPRNVLPERKKWCLKNIVIESPDFQTWDIKGKLDPGYKPHKDFHKLLSGTVVNVLRANEIIPGDVESASRSAIAYQKTYYDSSGKRWITTRVTGWVKDDLLDDYMEDDRDEFRKFVVKIRNQTENSTDAQQYLYIEDNAGKSQARYNMCGELCVAYITGQDIDTVLSKWRTHPNKEYSAVYDRMVGKADKPLWHGDVETLFKAQDVEFERYSSDPMPLADADPGPGRPDPHRTDQRRVSAAFDAKARDHYFVTNVRINTNTGALRAEGERNHWIVVDRFTRNGGRVELYNPFPNRHQEYSFGEFYKSIGGNPKVGWWIKKDVNPTFAKQKVASAVADSGENAFQSPVFEVAIDNPTPEIDAEQYMKVEGAKKTNLCGEFCVSFILTQSIENSFKRWTEAQESVKKQGKQPETSQLLTWLKAYGFINRNTKPDQSEKPKRFSIDAVLNYWKAVQPDLFNSILGGGKNEKTGPEELKTILRAYGYDQKKRDFNDGGLLSSPSKTAEKLKTHFFITGVVIDGSKGGRLGGNIPHWVVVDKITPIGNLVGGNGGWVELYNPFLNRWEEYSYQEFQAAYNGGGLWVARDVTPVFTRQPRAAAMHTGKNSQKNSSKTKGKKSIKPVKTQKELVQRSLQRLKAGEPSNTVAKGLAKQLDVSVKEAQKFLGLSKKEESPRADVEELMCEQLKVDSIPPEIGRWMRERSQGDAFLTEQLTDALLEFGILSVDVENKKCSRIDLEDPALPKKIQSVLQTRIDRSNSGSQSISKIVNTVGPTFAFRAIEEIKDILATMADEALQAEEAKKKRLMIPREDVPVPAYRVMWDWERDDFKGVFRPNLPCVFRCGELQNNAFGHYVKLTEEWQFFWFDLCCKIYYDRYHEDLTPDELEWLGSKWTSVGANTTAFTNEHGIDKFRNYVLRKRLDAEDPRIYTLVCGGASLAGTPVLFQKGKKRRWMLKVAHFNGNLPPPPAETIDPYTDPRVFFATTIRNKRIKHPYSIEVFDEEDPSLPCKKKEIKHGYSINRFPQFHRDGRLYDCPVPLVAYKDIYFPMKYLVPIPAGTKAWPYFPPEE